MGSIMPRKEVMDLIKKGVVIPASPLALDENRQFDPISQQAIYQYYVEAGSGGIAVAVHSTQFEIREDKFALFEAVLKLAADCLKKLEEKHQRPLVKISGVCGSTEQAVREAELSRNLGYDAVLLSLAALSDSTEAELIEHCKRVAEEMPLIGFYLQEAVGGKKFSIDFWTEFAKIENVVAIKIAPFNRYATMDVVRGLVKSGRQNDVTLYTGNDDNIVVDLLTPFEVAIDSGVETVRIRGGLLGQFCVWTKAAVELMESVHRVWDGKEPLSPQWLTRAMAWTDANAAVFDAANGFFGCIPGINEVLHRQGLMKTHLCLDESLGLSPGQGEELDRVCKDYPWLVDDEFIRDHLAEWMKPL